MQLGAVAPGPVQAEDPWSHTDPWGLAAVGAGKAGGKGGGVKCFICKGNHFARDCPESKGRDKGKGKGKGMKGPAGRKGWGLCRDFQRTGHCARGDSCPWAHVKVPNALNSIANLVLEDLGEVVMRDGIYEVQDESKLDPAAILAGIGEEIQALRADGGGGSAPGFHRQPE